MCGGIARGGLVVGGLEEEYAQACSQLQARITRSRGKAHRYDAMHDELTRFYERGSVMLSGARHFYDTAGGAGRRQGGG